jgi:glycosyltransferase involved in cell wall biosynthesis
VLKRVLIIEEELSPYRVPFYAKLQVALQWHQIGLRVAYSDAQPTKRCRHLTIDLPAEYGFKVRAFRGADKRFVFQPLFGEAARADLVVIEQASKFILNHILLPASLLGLKRVAFWGHGRSRAENRSALSEWHKRKTLNWVDWWFAYTRGTAEYLVTCGVPKTKIATIENSIDTEQLRADLRSVSEKEMGQERARLGICPNARVGIFCGCLNEVKGLPLLLEAAKLIKLGVPEFHLLLVGQGAPPNGTGLGVPEATEWIHFVGPQFDREKARLLKLAEVFLLPGAVGLAILDAFAAKLPLITTDIPYHGPEVEYLEHGRNGLILPPNAEQYAGGVVGLLSDSERLTSMRAAADETGRKYSIDRMVANFCDGICKCLQLSPSSGPAVQLRTGNLGGQGDLAPRDEARRNGSTNFLR